MNITLFVIIVISLGIIVSAILLLKQSAKKFNLTEEQLKKIKDRNEKLNKEDDID